MLGGELLDHLRVDVLRDPAAPYLWSDELVMRLLNEAQRQFARKTFCLIDTYELQTDTPANDANGDLQGVSTYALPVETLFVWSVQLEGDTVPLHNLSRRRLPNLSEYSLGRPRAYTTDEAIRHVRFAPTPDGYGGYQGAAGPYKAFVRRSLRPTELIDADTAPQIPEEYHLDLCDFVAWRCLTLPDEDGQSARTAKEFERFWLERVNAAKAEVYQRMTGPDAYAIQNWTLGNPYAQSGDVSI